MVGTAGRTMHSVLHACGDEALRNDDGGQGDEAGKGGKREMR